MFKLTIKRFHRNMHMQSHFLANYKFKLAGQCIQYTAFDFRILQSGMSFVPDTRLYWLLSAEYFAVGKATVGPLS